MTVPSSEPPPTGTCYASPLRGVRVVDFGQWIAGPAAAMLLADAGADVVHVDPPEGPRRTGYADRNLNRGKSRVRLDLHDPADLAEARRLVAGADVVVENFHPGTMAAFGLDHDSLRATHPGLVYLSLPGFASTDPEHQDVAAYEGIIAAAVGEFADMGVNRVLMGIEASYSPLPLGSTYAAVFGAMAVTLALRARLRHGVGDLIEVPIASSLLEALSYNSMEVVDLPPRYLSRREREIVRRREEGIPMDLSYAEVQELLDPFYRTYRCADGRPFYIVAVSHRGHVRHLLERLGIWDDAVAAGLPVFDPYLSTEDWPDGADCTVLGHPLSVSWSAWISARIAAALAAEPLAHWEERFAEWGIPAAGQRTSGEWMTEEHPLAAGLLVETDDPGTGPTRRIGPAAWLTDTGAAVPPVPRDTAPLDPAAGWLDDVTVVDLTNVIAGPTMGSTMARFGARVVKVDPPRPTFDPWNTVLCGLHSNRGKESLLLDARSPDGKAALHRLLATADVVTVNATSRQLASLGLSPAELAGIAPNAVLAHLDAWGGPRPGPWSDRTGYDDLVQATTGVMTRFGGGLDTPEEHAHFGTIDVLGGLCGVLSIALALYTRDATGRVLTARTSLAAAGQLLQAPFLYDHAHRGPWDEPSGRAALGEGPGHRFYRASDRWMFVVVPGRGRDENLAHLIGGDPTDLDDAQLTKALGEAFAVRSVEDWRRELGPRGVSVQPLSTLADLREAHTHDDAEPWSDSSFRFTRIADHPSGHAVTLVGPGAVRPRHAAVTVPHDARKYGRDTRRVLAELGYAPAEIDALFHSGAVSESWSERYLPR